MGAGWKGTPLIQPESPRQRHKLLRRSPKPSPYLTQTSSIIYVSLCAVSDGKIPKVTHVKSEQFNESTYIRATDVMRRLKDERPLLRFEAA
jgi:hypothetical protein